MVVLLCGTLWKLKDEGNAGRYRCHIGYAFSEEKLLHKQIQGAEAGLSAAIRMREERKHVLTTRAEVYGVRGFPE